MEKKGQVTLYIVIGLLLVALVSVVVYVRLSLIKGVSVEELVAPARENVVQAYVEDCVADLGKDAFKVVYEQGGYLDQSGVETFEYFGKDITLLVSDGRNDVKLGLNDIEKDVASYIKRNSGSCVNGLGNKFVDFEVTDGKVRDVKVLIGEDFTGIDVDFERPIKIKKGGVETELDKLNLKLNLKLGYFYNNIASIINREIWGEDVIVYLDSFGGLIKHEVNQLPNYRVYKIKHVEDPFWFKFGVER